MDKIQELKNIKKDIELIESQMTKKQQECDELKGKLKMLHENLSNIFGLSSIADAEDALSKLNQQIEELEEEFNEEYEKLSEEIEEIG